MKKLILSQQKLFLIACIFAPYILIYLTGALLTLEFNVFNWGFFESLLTKKGEVTSNRLIAFCIIILIKCGSTLIYLEHKKYFKSY